MRGLLSIAGALLCLSAVNAQGDLKGSIWMGLHEGAHDTVVIEFGVNDTIYLEDSILLDVPIATYQYVAGQLNFTDIGENSLCEMVPATYDLQINRDSLRFIPVTDPCEDRLAILTDYNWSRSNEAVHQNKLRGEISIYPSPYDLSVYLELPAWFDRSEYKIFSLKSAVDEAGRNYQ